MARARLSDRTTAVLHVAVLGGLICVAAILAFNLRRAGHSEGDDFALYLRQARSLFDGDTGAVVADNRFSVLYSDPAFSPIAYPWGWPLLLAPFVHLWDVDYDRLKLVEIAAFCTWLVLFHGIVRRRLGRIVATTLVAVMATAPAYLEHADQLLTEFPQMAAVGVVIWWYDRIRARSSLLTAPYRDLVVLGLLVVAAFNIRRESVVLVAVIAVMGLIDVWRDGGSHRMIDLVASFQHSWRQLVTPLISFVVGAVVFHLLLPTELMADNGNGPGFIDDRWREAPRILSGQLGLGEHPLIGGAVLLLAATGAIIGVRRRPTLDTPLVLLAVFTALAVGTHLRRIDRYWLQVTPWVLMFAATALVTVARYVVGRSTPGPDEDARRFIARRSMIANMVAMLPLAALAIGHLVVVTDKVADVRDANAAGVVQDGPAHPLAVEMIRAVDETTPPDAVIAYYRARTMTLLTDRRSIQTRDAEAIRANSDFWVQRRDWSFWQPGLDDAAIRDLGFVEVWSNDRYVLWCTSCPG